MKKQIYQSSGVPDSVGAGIRHSSFVIRYSIVLLFYCLLPTYGVPQQKGNYLTIESKCVDNDNNQPILNVNVSLYEGNSLRESTHTAATGTFNFNFDFDKSYFIKFTHPDYYAQRIDINTNVPKTESKKWFLFNKVNITLVKKTECPELDTAELLKKSFIKIAYDNISGEFNHTKRYTETMHTKLNELIERCKKIKAEQLLAEKMKREQEEQEKKKEQTSVETKEEEIFITDEELKEKEYERLRKAEENKKIKEEMEQKIITEAIKSVKEYDKSFEAKKIDEKTYQEEKEKVETKTLLERMDAEYRISIAEEALRKAKNEKQIKATENANIKSQFMDNLIAIAKETETSSTGTKITTDYFTVKKRTYPFIYQTVDKTLFRTVITTIIITPAEKIKLYKYEYLFGGSYYFINLQPVEKDDYNHELAKYLTIN